MTSALYPEVYDPDLLNEVDEVGTDQKIMYFQSVVGLGSMILVLPFLLFLAACQPAIQQAQPQIQHHLDDSLREMIPSHGRKLMENPGKDASTVELFTTASFTVVGPSVFPKPSDMISEDALPHLQPTFGKHRPEEDAVFVFAAEYKLNTYLCFVESLRRTGYKGDIVFAVSILDIKEAGVEQYLTTTPHVITYVLELSCFNAEMEETSSSKGGMRVCQLHNLYADSHGNPLPDPREARTIATTRYELYWLWCLHYRPHAWIMLLDARDSYFQTNPFDTVPREEVGSTRMSGMLHFFGENADATRIGKSPKNRKWLTNAYGDVVVAALEHKPTICSGSTMGEQVAMVEYLKAMVAESDDTGTKLMGADQGFHNYLYYTNKLASALAIRSVTVFDQGSGAINNLGAMRTAPLEDWGNGRILDMQSNTSITVLNWDGSISPVMHQFDRHPVLSKYVYKYMTGLFRDEYFGGAAASSPTG